MRGFVEGLASVEGKDVVWLPPLGQPLRHEHGGPRCWCRGGPPAASRFHPIRGTPAAAGRGVHPAAQTPNAPGHNATLVPQHPRPVRGYLGHDPSGPWGGDTMCTAYVPLDLAVGPYVGKLPLQGSPAPPYSRGGIPPTGGFDVHPSRRPQGWGIPDTQCGRGITRAPMPVAPRAHGGVPGEAGRPVVPSSGANTALKRMGNGTDGSKSARTSGAAAGPYPARGHGGARRPTHGTSRPG